MRLTAGRAAPIITPYPSGGQYDKGGHHQRGVRYRKHHQGEGRAGGGSGARCDEEFDAARRAHRASRVRRFSGEAPKEGHRPQPTHGKGSADTSGPHHPIQAGKGLAEHPLSSEPRVNHRFRGLVAPVASSWRLPSIFFLLTVLSTLYVGGIQGIDFWSPDLFRAETSTLESLRAIAVYGAPFSFTLLATLGAFIIIKSRFPHRKALIDIGLAGPFAGFLVVLPALVVGIATSRPGPPLPPETSISFGEPLLFQWFSSAIWPNLPKNYDLYISPIGLAAWFGLLLTALNLIPIGQLDGGHASYALLQKGAYRLSAWAFFAFLPMAYFGPSWLFWALLLYALGIRRPHPPTRTDEVPPPRSRYAMGALALAVFVLCSTPEPVVVDWTDIWTGLKEWLAS